MNLILTQFGASWCVPSQSMRPVMTRLIKTYRNQVHFSFINVDQNKAVQATYQILSCPTFILFDGDKELERRVGAQSEQQLRELIEAHLE